MAEDGRVTGLYLGLDGGGTGCRAVLADAQGVVRGRGMAGPANVMSDRDGAIAAIRAALAQALDGADPARVSACLGLAGAEVSGAADWLPPLLGLGRCAVVQDADTAVTGALGTDDGIVAAIGTGSVFSRQIGGVVTTIGGRGAVLGDEASGAWIGRRLLARALRAADGLAEDTPLLAGLRARLGGVAGIIALARDATGAAFAAQARAVADAADDPAAQAILTEAEAEIDAYLARLSEGRALPVVLLGGLAGVFAPRLAPRWPVAPARGTALDGALARARRLGEG